MFQQPIIPQKLETMVELFISCTKLKDLDTFSKSDPIARVYSVVGTQKTLIGQTERISNELNPKFVTPIKSPYKFEVVQKIIFEVVDDDGGSSSDLIGTIETTMGEVMGRSSGSWSGDLKVTNNNKSRGTIFVRTESL